jgi:hypothetical protein
MHICRSKTKLSVDSGHLVGHLPWERLFKVGPAGAKKILNIMYGKLEKKFRDPLKISPCRVSREV